MAKRVFIPRLVGVASFANGGEFTVEQVNKKGGCRITNSHGKFSYSRSVVNAWASIRYMARIDNRSERSNPLS